MEQKESLKELLKLGRLKLYKTAPREIRKLFAIVERDLADYMGTEVASEQEVADLIAQARDFTEAAHDFIGAHHPNLVKKYD